MSVAVYNLKGSKKGSVSLARIASIPVREDIIKRAVASERSKVRQSYGADPLAGKRTSAHYHGRRGIRLTMMNRELARMKRIHGHGFLNFTARFVPQARKGRKAHPPKATKDYTKNINQKERFFAVLSAMAAGTDKKLVKSRGHAVNGTELPLVFSDDFETLKKSKDVVALLKRAGLEKELDRLKKKKVRAGKGKARGRKYVRKRGPLVIVKEDRGIVRAVRNIPGVDASPLGDLTVSMVAPGGRPGRLLVFTESALKEVEKLPDLHK